MVITREIAHSIRSGVYASDEFCWRNDRPRHGEVRLQRRLVLHVQLQHRSRDRYFRCWTAFDQAVFSPGRSRGRWPRRIATADMATADMATADMARPNRCGGPR